MIIEKCPNCKASHVQTHMEWAGLSGLHSLPGGKGRVIWNIHKCQNDKCNGLILIVETDQKTTHLFPLGEFELDATTDIPDLIRDDFREAGLCLTAGCFKASLVMSRRALQRCLKAQGCVQRNLADAIGAGINNDILRKAFHDLENANQKTASQVLEFTRLLIHEFYEIPAAAAQLKANRQKTT